jgi:arsenite/tail-anchored protein-transporting ATPase
MTRILLISGKGGVGKTTVAAATGIAAAKRGYRTLVMSLDLAHSLSDSFDVGRSLFDQNRGAPASVAHNLDVQEIDVQSEIERHWTDVHRYVTDILVNSGVRGVVAEEVAIIPGTEDIIALMYLNEYVEQNKYDLIVLDAPPTGESLRFVSIYATLEWYMRKRFQLDRNLVKYAGPLIGRIADIPLPDDGYFNGIQQMFRRLDGVDALLRDPSVTTVRIVTNAEKMVVRESQRAFMYFSLYGMTTDQVVVNRLMPSTEGYFARWADQQGIYLDEIRAYFDPVPVSTLPMFPQEVVGAARLDEVADALYASLDPTATLLSSPPYSFEKDGDSYTLRVSLPFAHRGDVDITRVEDNLILRVSSFKRHIPLPRSMLRLKTAGASMRDGHLVVRFREPDL